MRAAALRIKANPKSAPIKSVTVNGKEWKAGAPWKEVVKLHDQKDGVTVEINC